MLVDMTALSRVLDLLERDPDRSRGENLDRNDHTDMRKGMQGLALLVQEGLGRESMGRRRLVFRGRAGTLIKALWRDGSGCRSTPSGWTVAASSGRRRWTVSCG